MSGTFNFINKFLAKSEVVASVESGNRNAEFLVTVSK